MPTYPPRGFSLLEVLVVIAIVAVITTFVSISITKNVEQLVFNEAVRFRTIIETVSDRAAIFQRPMIIRLNSKGYKVMEKVHGNWIVLEDNFLGPYEMVKQVNSSSSVNEILINGMGFMMAGKVSFSSINKTENSIIESVVFFDELGRVEIR